ncbi:MAG: phosphohistidine phosphatase SixA [Rhodospirillaceae bacterium]|nr:phosphohistidine phosphatase SixA [Rhodospirillaceae bacterium]
MTLYLVQHGDALSKAEDSERRLSEKGRRDAGRMAAFLSQSGVKADRVYHSGKARACETAMLLSEGIGNGVVEEIDHGLAPNDPTDNLKTLADRWHDNVMVVGHLPFMGRMVSHLLTGSADGDTVTFEPGAVAALEKDVGGGWTLLWMVRPSLLGGLN